MAFNFLKNLDADDIFISYTRLDASTYAAGLADELTKLGFSCFIDKLGTDPNSDLPETLKRKIRSCSMLVVVSTPRAAERKTIEEEIREFLSSGRTSIVPVNFNDAVYKARWYSLIEGVAPEPEPSPTALDDGDPSDSVVSRIKKQFNYRRRDERLRRTTRRAIAVLVLLLIAIAVAAGVAWQQLARATAETAKATKAASDARDAEASARKAEARAQQAQEAAQRSEVEANAARDDAATQRNEATQQKDFADAAKRDAEEKTKLADAASARAKEAEGRATIAQARADSEQARAKRQAAIADIRAGANRSQNYLRRRPEDVRGSLLLALDALKTAERVGVRSADADAALRESLALLPLRRGRARLDRSKDIAFSPDGLHYATVAAGVLRVYAAPEGDAGDAKPLLRRRCGCEAVALANGLTRIAVVLSFSRGFRIFDLKDDSQSRVLPPVKGARGEPIGSAQKLALSPGGRYLALYVDEGEDEGRHSKLLVLDTESGEPVHVYDDAPAEGPGKDIAFGPTGSLNTHIRDIAFGPTGDLAIVGKRLGMPEGRAVIWRLNADANAADTPRKLTSDSFKDYEVIPQESDVSVVAPGADETHFATDKGVWKRPAWQTRFDPAARIPAPADGSVSSVGRMAFRPDGRSLVLARGVVNRSDEENTLEEIVEVWDTAGHKGRVEAFHTAEVVHAGFEPGGRLVAALTEHDSKTLTDGPLGENRAHRLRVYEAGTGAEVAAPEPAPKDVRRIFYVGPDAAHIVTVSGSVAQVWDVWAKGEAKQERSAPFGDALKSLEAVGVSHGGRFLALAGFSGDGMRVVIYRSDDDSNYAEVRRFGLGQTNLEFYEGLKISADGRRLVVLYRDYKNPTRVYDDGVENAALRERLNGLEGVGIVALSANGRYLAVSDQFDFTGAFRMTGRARLLDLSEGSWETLLDGELASSIAFSPDGEYVGLGSSEGVLHVFETAKSGDARGAAKGDARNLKEEVARLQHAGRISAVAFSDDGRYVVTASSQPQPYRIEEQESYPLRVWLLRPAELITESEQRLGQAEPPKYYERGL